MVAIEKYKNMDYLTLTTDLQHIITSEQAWHYNIIPKTITHEELIFYVDESLYDKNIKDELEILFGKKITLEKTPSEIINKTLGKYYWKSAEKAKQKSVSTDISNYKPEDFLNKLIMEAKNINSSDIHIEIYEERCRVRLRIDGKLIERYTIKKQEYPSLVNKVKIKANIDIAEKRLPQDGRIIFKTENTEFDIRVSVLPTLNGEKIVLRLLSKDATNIDIQALGFGGKQLDGYMEGIKKTSGIVLISGPTGSGKTTTLYATLKILNREETNILTVEDPIEYTLEGINQVQLKESIGLTFASALRTFLRQDPDIIMLGEIRDTETAQMAIRASLTGHLVLSTIHTNSAWGIITRLTDMGVPSFLIASTMNLAIAQRLVRILCPFCKEEIPFDDHLFPANYELPHEITKQWVARGCEKCYYTGYKGRRAVYEVIPIDSILAENIKNKNFDVSSILKEKGITRLSDNSFYLFERGETTIEEIYSILLTSH